MIYRDHSIPSNHRFFLSFFSFYLFIWMKKLSLSKVRDFAQDYWQRPEPATGLSHFKPKFVAGRLQISMSHCRGCLRTVVLGERAIQVSPGGDSALTARTVFAGGGHGVPKSWRKPLPRSSPKPLRPSEASGSRHVLFTAIHLIINDRRRHMKQNAFLLPKVSELPLVRLDPL